MKVKDNWAELKGKSFPIWVELMVFAIAKTNIIVCQFWPENIARRHCRHFRGAGFVHWIVDGARIEVI